MVNTTSSHTHGAGLTRLPSFLLWNWAYQRVLGTMEIASKQSLESFEKAMQQAQRHTGEPEK